MRQRSQIASWLGLNGGLLLVLGLALGMVACGFNLYESLVSKDSEAYYLEEARNHLNAGQYAEAEAALAKVSDRNEEKALFQVTTTLGQSGLNLWDVLLAVLDKLTASSDESAADSGGDGMTKVFSVLSDSTFGEGDERALRLAAIKKSIALIRSAPNALSTKMVNLRCFLAGVLAMPAVNDGTAAMLEATAALENLATSVTGSGATAEQCPGLSDLDAAMAKVAQVRASLGLVLSQTSDCPILDFANSTDTLNEVETRLKKLLTAADKGCPTVSCTDDACRALQLGCVQESLATSEAKEYDGVIDQCELIYNCRTENSCF